MGKIEKTIFDYRFLILLCALVLMLLAAPFARELDIRDRPTYGSLMILVVFSILIAAAVFAASEKRNAVVITIILTASSIILQALFITTKSKALILANLILEIVVIGYVVIVILKHIFTRNRVTVDTISAALCSYLLIGFLWALVYFMYELLMPGSFSPSPIMEGQVSLAKIGDVPTMFQLYLYYSLVTLTTLGYGDVIPISPTMRMCAAIEAFMGQIFIAVLVARLVALQIFHAVDKN